MSDQTAIRTIETAWIPLSDGRRLAARLFLPAIDCGPAPAILEYLPYRRRDGTRARDDETHLWFAANGYASARVDIAGTGDSDGLVEDEYVIREQDDAIEVIAWLAAQSWCSGSVGMIGISWGGFNGLQVAARCPPALKAVVTLCSTVDRYTDDVHFMGGCLLGDNIDWGGAFFTYAALPPDPAVVGDAWQEMWRKRIAALDLYPATWLKHQRRDAFWRHGSVAENYSAIETPILAVGGWADGYTAAVFRLTENLPGFSRGIVGPWGHRYPYTGVPGPAIGFLHECKRWWDRWLKDLPNDVEDDPALRIWLQDPIAPAAHYDVRPGRWLGLEANLSEATEVQSHGLASFTSREPPSIRSHQATGVAAGEWCAYALGKVAPEMPLDQSVDDAGSMVFDGPVLSTPLEIVGRPVLRLRVAADRPQAFLAVRLCDVGPDGSVARITYGLLNICHANGHEQPRALVPGEFRDVEITLNEIAQVITSGHRLRVSISTSYWPMVWPSPSAATVTIDPAGSVLELPVLRRDLETVSVSFCEPEFGPPMRQTITALGKEERLITRDVGNGETTFLITRDDGWGTIDDIDTAVHYSKKKEFSIGDDPLSSRASICCQWARKRAGWNVRVETEVTMRSDAHNFILTGSYRAFAEGELFSERFFERTIERDHL